jgi:hypothetical protein
MTVRNGPRHWFMRDRGMEPDIDVLSLQVKHSIMRLAKYHGNDAAAFAIAEGINGVHALEADWAAERDEEDEE